MQQQGVGALRKIYSAFLAGVPVLQLYASPVRGVSLAEFGLLAFLLLTLPAGAFWKDLAPTRAPFRSLTLGLVFGLSGITALALLLGDSPFSGGDVVARFAKLLLWAVVTSYLNWVLFHAATTIRVAQVVAVVGSLYLIVQWGAWEAGRIFLPPVLNHGVLLPLNSTYRDSQALIDHYATFYIRPASFFGEPAYFGYYALVVLNVVLFMQARRISGRQWVMLALVTCAALLSTSTTAIYLVPVTWAVWLVRGLRSADRERFVVRGVFLVLALFVTALLAERRTGVFSGFVTTSAEAARKLWDWQSSARLGRSFEQFSQLEGAEIFIGVGMGNEDIALKLPNFYSDVATIGLGTGLLGLCVLVAYWLRLMRIRAPGAGLLVVWYIVISFGEQFLYQGTSFLLLAFVLYARFAAVEHPPGRVVARVGVRGG